MKYQWTKLQGTDLWVAAEGEIRAANLDYHNMDHLRALYGHAERFGIPYDRRLDENILTHDVVQDLGPSANEDASAAWLLSMTGREEATWADPIHSTKLHQPSMDEAGLAMLDLADFTNATVSRRNTELLRREAAGKAGPGFDLKAWLMGTMNYLDGLRGRIADDLPNMQTHPHLETWQRILRGIEITMECAPHRYDPHPASGISRYPADVEAMMFALADSGEFDPDMIASEAESPERGARAIDALVGRGLAIFREDSEFGRVIMLREEALEWVARMREMDQGYPSP